MSHPEAGDPAWHRAAGGGRAVEARRPPLRKVLREIFDTEMGRAHPLRVGARFALWQAWRRALRRPLAFRSVTGTRLRLLPGASNSLSGFWYLALPDFAELAFALHFLRPGDLFVDAGANQGGWSLVAAGRGARVAAFEAVPLSAERLRANIDANAGDVARRVRAFGVALGEAPGFAVFTSGLDVGNHRVSGGVPGRASVVRVPVVTIDDALDGEKPSLLKVDVEGDELAVLRGAARTLEEPALSGVIIETFRPANFGCDGLREIERLLGTKGFAPVAYEPHGRNLRQLVDPSEGSQNTIYVRGREAVEARLRAAAPVVAFGRPL